MNLKHFLITLLLLLFFSEMGLIAQTVKRGPYLQMSTPTSTIIRWRTDITTQSKVWYGTTPGTITQLATSSGSTKEHEVLVNGLMPATIYYYRIGDENGPYSPLHGEQYFKTHPAGNFTDEPIRVWMLGNAGTKEDEQREVRDAYYSVVNGQHIDMMLLSGDNAYDDGTDSEYQEAWFEGMYEARLVNSVMWSCFGNHDAGDADSEEESGTYYEIFNFPRNGEAGGVPSGTEAYYSFDYGNIHVISLNTVDIDRETGDPMIDWLEEDLAANEKKWQVVLLHHRPYTGSNGNDSDDDEKPTDVREFMLPRLEAAGVDLVLSSHSHSYQRSFLINGHYGKSNTFDANVMGIDMGDGQPDGDGPYSKVDSDIGTVYVVAGTAGQRDYDADELNHPVMYYNSGSPGSVQLLISDTELVFQFINENEEIEDYFTIEKGPSLPVSGFRITNPAEGSTFTPQQNITITADTTGSLFEVDHVDFYIDNNLIGTVNSFPFYLGWTVPGAGDFEIKAVAHGQDSSDMEESIVHITAGSSQVCASIFSGNDDAEERASGSVALTSGDLEIGEDNSLQHIGLRFQNLNLPPNALIDSAFIQFTVDETDNENPCLLQIYGEKSLNSGSYEDLFYNISLRPKTNEYVSWSPANWDFVGQSSNAQRSPNIASVIQEVIAQPGYNNQQALAFVINGFGKRVAESYNGDANEAPELCIYYTPAFCEDFDNDGICDNNDPCPAGPEYGMACSDGNPGTHDDKIDENCNCVGIPFDCQILQLDIGAPCDDNNSGTYDDVIDSDCNCVGTLFDCPALQLEFGTACDDNNNATYDDIITTNCDCAGTPYDCPLLLADFGMPCDDSNPNTGNDVIDENCNCLGSLFDCPVLESNIGDVCDDGNPFTINDVVTAGCLCVGILIQEETIVVQVGSESDDAEEDEAGDVSVGSSDLELIVDDNNQKVGIRFLNTGIPQGAVISDAYIQFTADETNTIDPCVLTITGEAADQPQTFIDQQFNISTRPRTNASVSWQPSLWNNTGDEGAAQRTNDLSPIIQELVERSSYSANSPMAFIIEGQGKRVAESYDGSANKAPKLYVSYLFYCEDDDLDGICNEQDQCAFTPEPGTPCNDNNTTTYDDVIDENCNCTGTPFDCPNLLVDIGTSCNDNNSATYDDVIDENCNCTGTPFDCPILLVDIGTSCNDNNSATYDDVIDENCNCTGTPYDCPIFLADIGTSCNDNNSATYDDVIDENCNCTGTPYDCPIFLADIGAPCDDGNPLTLFDEIDSDCACHGLPPGTQVTVCSRVAADEDDAEEEADGSVKNSSGDIELIFDDTSQIIGLRFINLNIPQGAVIHQADIQFMVDETENLDPCLLSVFAEASDNPASFSSADYNISDRARTQAEVSWSPPLWTEKGAAGPGERTGDISTVLQEVVNRSGFSQNSAVVIMMNGTGKRVAEAYEGGSDKAAELCVTYSIAIPPSSMMLAGSENVLVETDKTLVAESIVLQDEIMDFVNVVGLKVYPNPAKEQLNLAFYCNAEMETQVQLQNINGQLLRVQTYQAIKGNNKIRIANLNLPNGVYMLRMQDRDGWQSRKFVILR